MPAKAAAKSDGSSGSPKSISELLSVDLTSRSASPNSADDEEFVVPSLGDELPDDHEIKHLLGFFIKNTYIASEKTPIVQIALDRCIKYLERDYVVIKINNNDGILSTHYPSTIPFIIGETGILNPDWEESISSAELHELLGRAHRARCRERFPVPVIHFEGNSICRSSTLAGSAEIYGRMTLDVFRPGPSTAPEGDGKVDSLIAAEAGENDESRWKAVTDLQTADIALLKQLNVGTIVDLMVENKKLKLGVPSRVTSSEKVDKENRYHSYFKLLSLPFPGCEFFKEFHDNNYIAEGLCYDWSQSMCDADLFIPEGLTLDYLNINWSEYKQWDIVQMTQNYIKYILKYTHESKEGVLIHCISGWDRTPLFISLLRMSLWADGVIHKSLSIAEMLFFTLAYDWMLFGHHLADRLTKNEDNLLFCFNILKHLIDDQFSVNPRPARKRLSSCVCCSDSEPSPKRLSVSSCVCDRETTEATKQPVPPSPECYVVADDSDDSTDSASIYNYAMSPTIGSSYLETEAGPSHAWQPTQRTVPLDMPSTSKSTVTQTTTTGLCGSWSFVTCTGSDIDSKSSQGSADDFSRNGRLTNIRRLFYRCYYQTLTDKHVNYTNVTMLKSIIRNLNEIANLNKQ